MSELINEFEKPNYLEFIRDRVTFAFNNKPVFDKYMRLMNVGVEELSEVLRQLMQERSIDTARGAQLDILGDIVGQPRVLVNAEGLPFFGFLGHQRAESFGDENDPTVGGFWWDENQPQAGDYVLDDNKYRLFIKAKIMKNSFQGTAEDVIRFIQFVFNVENVQVSDYGRGTVTILVEDSLDELEKYLLYYFLDEGSHNSHFIPKVLGVNYRFGFIPKESFFSYLGAPNAAGYGWLDEDTGEVIGGGKYATIAFE